MKQKLSVLSAFLCGAIFFSGVSYAANSYLKAFPVKNSKIEINGSETTLESPVVTINNSLYIPLKELGQKAGYAVSSGSIIRIDTFKKLPISYTRNNVTITLNSLNKVDGKVLLNVTIKNDTDKNVDIDLSFIRADDNVKGRKVYTTSASSFYTPVNDNWSLTTKRLLDDSVTSKSELTGDIQIASVTAGTKNIHFLFESHSLSTSFPFSVDTDGLF